MTTASFYAALPAPRTDRVARRARENATAGRILLAAGRAELSAPPAVLLAFTDHSAPGCRCAVARDGAAHPTTTRAQVDAMGSASATNFPR